MSRTARRVGIRAVPALLAALLLVSCDVGVPTIATGQWVGSYTCNQGLTGLTLHVGGAIGQTVSATFEFYAIESNPDLPSGFFRMAGTLSGNRLALTAGEWIEQPTGWITVDLDGTISADAQTYSGEAIAPPSYTCSTFDLTRVE